MNISPRPRPLFVLAALVPLLLAIAPTGLDARTKHPGAQSAHVTAHQPSAPKPPASNPRETINAWTVGLAAGLIEGAPIRFAAEMSRVVDDGDNLHVLPIVTRGPTENVNSLLYLRGINVRSSIPTRSTSIRARCPTSSAV